MLPQYRLETSPLDSPQDYFVSSIEEFLSSGWLGERNSKPSQRLILGPLCRWLTLT